MTVEEITARAPGLLEAINSLVQQLSSSAVPLTDADLDRFMDQKDVHLFVFKNAEGIVAGMLTLATFQSPTGLRGWIEDVVVDESTRGLGAGQALVEAALSKAKELGLATVDLTSRPHREAANRLYLRCGFVPRETNIYRYQV